MMRVTSSAECSCSLRCSAGTGYAQSTARRLASKQHRSGAAHAARQRAPARRLLVRLAASLQTQAPAGNAAVAEGLAAWLEQRGVPRDKSNAVAACGADGVLQLVTARPVARWPCGSSCTTVLCFAGADEHLQIAPQATSGASEAIPCPFLHPPVPPFGIDEAYVSLRARASCAGGASRCSACRRAPG